MPAESIESIIDRIRDREQARLALRARMDEDYLLYRGDPYIPPAGEGTRREDAYTSERLGIAMLRHIHRMLYDSCKQPLRCQLGFYGIVRGGYVAARALLKK